jgi:hypothetical protein
LPGAHLKFILYLTRLESNDGLNKKAIDFTHSLGHVCLIILFYRSSLKTIFLFKKGSKKKSNLIENKKSILNSLWLEDKSSLLEFVAQQVPFLELLKNYKILGNENRI